MEKNRIYWIDVAKGMAMLLIILGHIGPWGIFQPYVDVVNYFHVPIWIILSALFLRPDEPFLIFLKKKGKRLLKPYYIFAIIIMLVHSLSKEDYLNIILGERKAGAIWFLPLLFSTLILAYWLTRFKLAIQICFSILCMGLSMVFSYFHIVLPFNIDMAFFMMPFALFAAKYKNIIRSYQFKNQYGILGMLVLGVATFFTYFTGNSITPNFFSQRLGFIPFTVAMVIIGGYIVCWLSQKIVNNCIFLKKTFLFVGTNSMAFLVLHQKLGIELLPVYRKIPLSNEIDGIIMFVIVLLYCSIASLIINKYFKFLIQ